MTDDLLPEIKNAVEKLASEVESVKERAVKKNDNRLTTNVLESQKLLEEIQGLLTQAEEDPTQANLTEIRQKVKELAGLMSGLAGDAHETSVPTGQTEGTMLGRTQDMRDGKIGERSKVRKLFTKQELEEVTPSLPPEPEPVPPEEKQSKEYLEFMKVCSKQFDSESCDLIWQELSAKSAKASEDTYTQDTYRVGDEEEEELRRATRMKPVKSEAHIPTMKTLRDPEHEKLSILKNCFTKAFETGVLNVPSEALYGVDAHKIENVLEQARVEYQNQTGSKYLPRFGKELPSEVEVHLRADKIQKGEPFDMIPVKRTVVITKDDLNKPLDVTRMSWSEIHKLARKYEHS